MVDLSTYSLLGIAPSARPRGVHPHSHRNLRWRRRHFALAHLHLPSDSGSSASPTTSTSSDAHPPASKIHAMNRGRNQVDHRDLPSANETATNQGPHGPTPMIGYSGSRRCSLAMCERAVPGEVEATLGIPPWPSIDSIPPVGIGDSPTNGRPTSTVTTTTTTTTTITTITTVHHTPTSTSESDTWTDTDTDTPTPTSPSSDTYSPLPPPPTGSDSNSASQTSIPWYSSPSNSWPSNIYSTSSVPASTAPLSGTVVGSTTAGAPQGSSDSTQSAQTSAVLSQESARPAGFAANKSAIIGVGTAAGIVVVLLSIALFFLWTRHRKRVLRRSKTILAPVPFLVGRPSEADKTESRQNLTTVSRTSTRHPEGASMDSTGDESYTLAPYPRSPLDGEVDSTDEDVELGRPELRMADLGALDSPISMSALPISLEGAHTRDRLSISTAPFLQARSSDPRLPISASRDELLNAMGDFSVYGLPPSPVTPAAASSVATRSNTVVYPPSAYSYRPGAAPLPSPSSHTEFSGSGSNGSAMTRGSSKRSQGSSLLNPPPSRSPSFSSNSHSHESHAHSYTTTARMPLNDPTPPPPIPPIPATVPPVPPLPPGRPSPPWIHRLTRPALNAKESFNTLPSLPGTPGGDEYLPDGLLASNLFPPPKPPFARTTSPASAGPSGARFAREEGSDESAGVMSTSSLLDNIDYSRPFGGAVRNALVMQDSSTTVQTVRSTLGDDGHSTKSNSDLGHSPPGYSTFNPRY